MEPRGDDSMDRAAAAAALRVQADALRDCRACALCEGRTQVVFGVGDPVADLMFIGEGPGFNEDRQGEPFVGQAGKLLTELLGSIGLRREDVYIANVVKCRPPDNRDPLPDEIAACSPQLMAQVQAIRPRVVCTLGRFATRLIAQTEAGMATVRGRVKATEVAGVPVLVFPVFHPAAALYTPANRDTLQEDFRKLRRLLDRGADALVSGEPAGDGAETAAGKPSAPDAETAPPIVPSSPSAAEGGARAEQLPLW
jgi:uracil-DNA glycosylase family 4